MHISLPNIKVAKAPIKASPILYATSSAFCFLALLKFSPLSLRLITNIFSPEREEEIRSKYPSEHRLFKALLTCSCVYFLPAGRTESISAHVTRHPSVPSHRLYTAFITSFSHLDSISDNPCDQSAQTSSREGGCKHERGIYPFAPSSQRNGNLRGFRALLQSL